MGTLSRSGVLSRTGILGIAIAVVAGCSTTAQPSAGAAADASTPSSECALSAGACGPGALCCSPIIGHRVHLAQDCKEEKTTALACRGSHPVGGGCVASDEAACYVRGRGTATEEIFYTPQLHGPDIELAGFELCSPQLSSTVTSTGTQRM